MAYSDEADSFAGELVERLVAVDRPVGRFILVRLKALAAGEG